MYHFCSKSGPPEIWFWYLVVSAGQYSACKSTTVMGRYVKNKGGMHEVKLYKEPWKPRKDVIYHKLNHPKFLWHSILYLRCFGALIPGTLFSRQSFFYCSRFESTSRFYISMLFSLRLFLYIYLWTQHLQHPGWPDWANFRLLGHC
jgi:hypothetical protein